MINAYLVDPVIIVKHLGYDENNEPIEPDLISAYGHVKWGTKKLTSYKGEEVVCAVMVYLSKELDSALGRPLKHEDMIQIEGESHEREILRIDQPKAFSGPHYEVYLG